MVDKIRENTKTSIVNIDGLDLVVLREVFPPQHFQASRWMTSKVASLACKKKFLEIGTGTGITALACAKQGAKVVATDITLEAVKNAKINSLLNDLDVEVRKSDVYSALKNREKFDLIFWNHPFDDSSSKVLSELDKSIYDPDYKSTEKYIRDGFKHLKKCGRLLLGTGMSANLIRLHEIATKHNLEMKEVARETLPPRNKIKVPYKVFIFEFVKIH